MKNIGSKEARLLALSNASEFIRSHGEEGGQYQEDYGVPLDIYFRECKKVATILSKMAKKYKKTHNL